MSKTKMNWIQKFPILLFIFLSSLIGFVGIANAYIPPYWMIMSRTSDNHGRGTYIINQTVRFKTTSASKEQSDEVFSLNERWIVSDENSMRLEVSGRGALKDKIRLTYVYKNDRRYFVDENGVRKFEKIANDFFEPYFHYRLSKNIKPLLVARNIVPKVSLKSEPHIYSEKKPLPDPEDYVRLGRTNGVIAYAIGIPPSSVEDKNPGLWIEQDQFQVLKLRLPSMAEVVAHNYKTYSGGLHLPSNLDVRWSDFSAALELTNASAARSTKSLQESLDPSKLNFGENPEVGRLMPNNEAIQSFYSRMR